VFPCCREVRLQGRAENHREGKNSKKARKNKGNLGQNSSVPAFSCVFTFCFRYGLKELYAKLWRAIRPPLAAQGPNAGKSEGGFMVSTAVIELELVRGSM
jgi:hypothetical protein